MYSNFFTYKSFKKLSILGLSLGVVFMMGVRILYAQTTDADALRGGIDRLSKEIEELEKEIATYRVEADKIASQKDTLKNTLSKIESERKKLVTDVAVTDKKLQKSNLTLAEVKQGLSIAQDHMSLNQRALEYSFRRIAELDGTSSLEILLADNQLSSFFQEINERTVLRSSLKDRITDLRYARAHLEVERSHYQTEQQQLEDLKQEILDKKHLVDQQKKEKDLLLKETQQEESKYQALIAEREALRKAFEQELFDYESKLKVILDPTLLPSRGSAVLAWPLKDIVVTQLFRATTGPHAGSAHSGVDFRANSDPVYAMADGVVGGTGDTDLACAGASFGKWVFVRFDNRLAATYGHLSIISVKQGQKVKRGQLIGYSGNTGRSTAPHLHVSLYADADTEGNHVVEVLGKPSAACQGKTLVQPRAATEAYLDALDYLPTLTSAMLKPGIKRD